MIPAVKHGDGLEKSGPGHSWWLVIKKKSAIKNIKPDPETGQVRWILNGNSKKKKLYFSKQSKFQ